MKDKGFSPIRSTLIYVTIIMVMFSFPYWWKQVTLADIGDYVMKFYWFIIFWLSMASIYGVTYWMIYTFKRKRVKWLDKAHVWLSAASFTVLFFQFIKHHIQIQNIESDVWLQADFSVLSRTILISALIFLLTQVLFLINIAIALSGKSDKFKQKHEEIDHLIE